MIAGHTFVDTPTGRACQYCGKTWLSVLGDREFWKPGVLGVAHSGALTENECTQLHTELDRIWDAVKEDARA